MCESHGMKALSLGGSQWQMELLRCLNNMGFETYVADINPECPCRALANHYIQIDTSDRDEVLKVSRENGIQLVIAEQTDRFVPIAAYVNEIMDLPGLRPNIASRFTDKLTMRNRLKGIIDMPAYAEISTISEALTFAAQEGYPLIIKPKSSQSSSGVFKVDNETELVHSYIKSLQYSNDGCLLIERFIDGPEITVEGLSIKGVFHLLAISEKSHYEFNPCVAKCLSFPPRYTQHRIEKIRDVATRTVETLGLEDGISHAEYRLLGDTPYLVEVAARGGGTKIAATIVPHICGFNVYELLVKQLTGQFVKLPKINAKAAVLMFLDFPAGTVKAIHGLDEVQRKQLAYEITLNFKPGDIIKRPEDDSQRLGYAIVLGEDRDEVDARCCQIKELIKLEYI